MSFGPATPVHSVPCCHNALQRTHTTWRSCLLHQSLSSVSFVRSFQLLTLEFQKWRMNMLFCARLEPARNNQVSPQQSLKSVLHATALLVVSSQHAHDTKKASGAWDPRPTSHHIVSLQDIRSPAQAVKSIAPHSTLADDVHRNIPSSTSSNVFEALLQSPPSCRCLPCCVPFRLSLRISPESTRSFVLSETRFREGKPTALDLMWHVCDGWMRAHDQNNTNSREREREKREPPQMGSKIICRSQGTHLPNTLVSAWHRAPFASCHVFLRGWARGFLATIAQGIVGV